jgi:alginate O-acetyltransferase complex protein AlgI
LAIDAVLPRGAKNAALLVSSIVFYAWGERFFVLVMVASIVANWLFGLAIEASWSSARRRMIVAAAITADIGLLAFYKYAGFLVVNLNTILPSGLGPITVGTPHLPLGISFFTFHALSYVVDVYRRDAVAQRNPIDFALYIAFFPQLVAGPIIRYHDIYRQLENRHFRLDLAASGIERFIAGLGKKMILANPLGEVADGIFQLSPDRLSTEVAWVGVVAYSLQIYLDFSAYSDMAIGLARIFGLNFLENFDYPYRARSIREFWRRWHISLTNFFRDYLYVPLGGNRVPEWRVWFNQLLVFVVCGLWHGAAWTFLVWGLFHGLFLGLERTAWGHFVDRLPAVFSRAYVMIIIAFTWAIFRSADVASAMNYITAMIWKSGGTDSASVWEFVDSQVAATFVVAVPVSLGLFTRLTSDWRCRAGQRRGELIPPIESVNMTEVSTVVLSVRLVILILIFVLSASKIAAGTYNPFIYFRF